MLIQAPFDQRQAKGRVYVPDLSSHSNSTGWSAAGVPAMLNSLRRSSRVAIACLVSPMGAQVFGIYKSSVPRNSRVRRQAGLHDVALATLRRFAVDMTHDQVTNILYVHVDRIDDGNTEIA